jgi:hypothetical protein
MRKLVTIGTAFVGLALATAFSAASCAQTPTNTPIRTFEGAQRMAVVCLDVSDTSKGAVPVPEDNCAPVASGVNGTFLPNHLIAAVTQTTRGELAIVDLTAGYVVDEDLSTPGVNFIPVGTRPTDVAIPPDGLWTYVSSATGNKPALFAIDSTRLLGDSTAVKSTPLQLTDLLACELPQAPLALAIASNPAAAPDGGAAATDGGAAGADGGANAGVTAPVTYSVLALLDAQDNVPARLVAIDPTPFITSKTTHQPAPGSLPPCTLLGSVPLSGTVPSTWFPGPAWPDGVPYVDGGVDLTGQFPPLGPASICGTSGDGGSSSGAAEGGSPVATGEPDAQTDETGADDAGAAPDGAVADAGTGTSTGDAAVAVPADDAGVSGVMVGDGGFALALAPLSSPRPASMIMRDDAHLVYVADSSIPVVHVIDVSDPTSPKELAPLLATSLATPARQVQVGTMALSPATRDYKRYLYAVDQPGATVMVFDVTDPVLSPHVPLQRPHAALNPLTPIDRITFQGQVAAMSFVVHDWPLQTPDGPTPSQSAYQGLLCNPNPAAHPNPITFNDLGAYYRVDQAGRIQSNATATNFPSRLRGVFAFVTLSDGTVDVVDVDDWDAPCRRPDPMTVGEITNSLDVPQPLPDGGNDLDPFHAPSIVAPLPGVPTQNPALDESPAVTLEPFYPVSAPNRIRSSVLERNDPSTGQHTPTLTQIPLLTDVNQTPVATSGQAGQTQPLLLPTALTPGWRDPTTVQNPTETNPAARIYLADAGTVPNPAKSPTPGVRLSFEDPTLQGNQDWKVTYEGVLPSSNGIVADIKPVDSSYANLLFTTTGANLCGLGVEDSAIGQARANSALDEMTTLSTTMGLPAPSSTQKTLPTWTTDYVEITDDILLQGDPYWGLPNACWDIPDVSPLTTADQRYSYCQGRFGTPGQTNPDLDDFRDAPILQAFPDHLVVGRFGFAGPIPRTQGWNIDAGSSRNEGPLKAIQCCFHSQAAFEVRTGGEWVAVGQQSVGLLHHVEASRDPTQNKRCVLSCDPKDSLLNARSFDVPWANAIVPTGATACVPPSTFPALDRDNSLAMRNPFFSYVTWGGCGVPINGDHTLTARDLTWHFSVSGGFSPLTLSLAGVNGTPVSPQSMFFIGSLGQLAVVDGSQQGLIIIDLNLVSLVANYF